MKPLLLLSAATLWLGLAALPAPAAPIAQAPTKVEQDYDPRPAIWLLSDEDTKIYLFGTSHMLPPGFKWRSPALDKVVGEASELVVESYASPETEDALVEKLVLLMFLEKPKPILERVPENRRAELARLVEKSPIPTEALDSFRTWAVGLLLGLGQILGSYGIEDPEQAPGVEDILEAEFRKAGKPIGSVEEPEVALAGLNSLPEQVQVELLLAGLDEADAVGAQVETSDHHWARGRYEDVAAEDFKGMPPAVYDALLTKRNAAWTKWLSDRLDKPGTVLFAVGAAHLAGSDSVQKMLETKGLNVTRFD